MAIHTITGSASARSESSAASNRLYTGDVSDFCEAMRLIVRGMAAEKRDTEAYNATLALDEQHWRQDTDLEDRYIAAAKKALAIYAEEVAAALKAAEARVLAKLRAMQSDSTEMEQIADALESGEYSPLAW